MGVERMVASKSLGQSTGWGGLRAERTHIFGGIGFSKRGMLWLTTEQIATVFGEWFVRVHNHELTRFLELPLGS